jgi:hypothetical protein
MKSAIILIDCWGYGFDWLPLVPEKKMYKNTVLLRFYGCTVTVRFAKKNRNYGLQRKTVITVRK